MTFSGKVDNGSVNKRLNFGGDPDHGSESPSGSSVFGSLPKFNHFFIGPLPTFPENFMQTRLEFFVQSCYC